MTTCTRSEVERITSLIATTTTAYKSSRTNKQREARAGRVSLRCKEGNTIKKALEERLEKQWNLLDDNYDQGHEESFLSLLTLYEGLSTNLLTAFSSLFPRRS